MNIDTNARYRNQDYFWIYLHLIIGKITLIHLDEQYHSELHRHQPTPEEQIPLILRFHVPQQGGISIVAAYTPESLMYWSTMGYQKL